MTQVQGFRLSPQQRHVWRQQADSRAFRSQAAVSIEGELQAEALRDAVARVAARHDVLHTSFRRSPGIRFPIQVIGQGAPPQWQTLDLSDQDEAAQRAKVDELFRQAARRPFDLERGPLVHASLLTLGPRRHVLLLGLPALCADRRTLSLLLRELAAACAHGTGGADGAGSADGEEEPVQYIQFSEWQNELLESDESRAGREFWQGQDLSPVFKLQLPGETAAKGGFAPEALALDLGGGAAARLDEAAAKLGASPRDVLFAAWQVLVWRLAGGHDVGSGLLLDGREHEELAAAVGLFDRFLPLRLALSPRLPFAEAVARTAAAVAEAADYQSFYAGEGDAEAGIPACFEYEEAEAPVQAGGLSFSFLRRFSCGERYKACLSVWRGADGLAAELLYDPRALPAELAAALAERFRGLLETVLADPRTAAGEVEILTGDERRRLIVELNRTAAETPGEPVHRLFERQAAKSPESAAVQLGDSRLTYAELEESANRLARHLISLGAGPDRLVAVYADRSPEMVVALLAALKTGGAYLPLDTAYPPERLAFMLDDARPVAVLTQSQHRERLPDAAGAVLCLDTDAGRFAGEDAAPPTGGAALDNLAYVIYTSGSTGRPKGVMVPHGGLVNYLAWAVREYRVEEGMAVPVHSPIGFDLTVTSLLAPLVTGGTVLLLAEERGVEGLGEALRGGPYSLLKVTPAHLALLGQGSETELEGKVGALIVGGETLLGEYLAPWRERAPSTRIFNEYGPTETVVGCTAYELPPGAELKGPVPIGRPVANTAVYLLDASSQPVPFGVPGELYVGGAGVTRGYLGRPDLTAERFVPDPFGGVPGARLYRTGDQARWKPGGDLEFLGRNDHQVKIRGFRLELGEIESVLASHPGVREAVVLAREDTPGERRLVAYMVTEPDAAPNVDELRLFLGAQLPDYMVPAIYLKLPALPLTPNGKVDRAMLPPPSSQRPDLEKEYVAPRTPLEEQLAEVWSEVLGIRQVGVFDSFFALGGDSIRSVRAVALLKEKGLQVAVEDLFRHQTIAELTAFLEQGDIPDPHGVDKEDEELARLVAELEGLSEEEAQARLREQVGVGGSEGEA
jgi:amino acid adenylation domain-containing protein